MIPIILEKRQAKIQAGRTFNRLIEYIQDDSNQDLLTPPSQASRFDNIINYAADLKSGAASQDKCVAIRTHGVTDLTSASIEMNAVSARNTRCKDPAFHFVLTWPEHENPHTNEIFDAAEHAIKSLGLAEHQYVLAIHVNTDNIHCHAAVNRINPDTFKSRNIEWANKTIHFAARESEIKHGWRHDNGIYIVEIDGQNNKSIILNPDHNHSKSIPRNKENGLRILPTWHDPDSPPPQLKSKRDVRREERAVARADLRQRYSQYRGFLKDGEVDYRKRTKDILAERRQALKFIDIEAKVSKLSIRKSHPITEEWSLLRMAEIYLESGRRKLLAEANSQAQLQSLRATRLPTLSWREWLYEQSNLGDRAALSALRGIVYQAQRDAKHSNMDLKSGIDTEAKKIESRDLQFQKVMSRLLADERKEVAIRSARSNAMRPFEVDALLIKHLDLQWQVTGNGNIKYNNHIGEFVFTDRGSRVTFDRVLVSDEDIRLALVHAQQKFGNQLSLTGDNPTFTARMACLADEMGIAILNPDMQEVIAIHRHKYLMSISDTPCILPSAHDTSNNTALLSDNFAQRTDSPQEPDKEECLVDELSFHSKHHLLRTMVLSIDPRAEFVIPDISLSHTIYSGPVVATFTAEDPALGFAQHLGRSVYALHPTNAPEHPKNTSLEIQYREGLPIVTIPILNIGKNGKGI